MHQILIKKSQFASLSHLENSIHLIYGKMLAGIMYVTWSLQVSVLWFGHKVIKFPQGDQ